MRVIFAIEFAFRKRIYSGIVRVIELPGYKEYHVRVMNSRIDNWLYGQHIFREVQGALVPEELKAGERTSALRVAVYDALATWLRNRVVAIPPGSKREPGTDNMYIHRIVPKK